MPSPPASDAPPLRDDLLVWLLGGVLALRVGIANHPIDEIDALFGVCFAVLAAGLSSRKVQLPRHWLWLGIAFTCTVFFSVWASPHRIVAAFALPGWWAPGFVFCACALLPKHAVPRLINFLTIPCTASAVAALYQRFVLWPQALQTMSTTPDVTARLSSGRALGLSLSPDLGGALALLGFFGALFHVLRTTGLRKGLWSIVGCLCLAGVAASRSAGVALALGVFAASWFALWLWHSRHLPGRKYGFLLFPLLPAAAMAILGRGPDALMRSMNERLWNWWVAWEAFGHSPIFGFGPGRFAAAYAQHRVPEANVTRYAHSVVFHGLVELGALGMLCLIGLVVAVVWRLFAKRVQKRSERLVVDDMMWAAGIALGLRCAFDYDAQIAQTACGLCAWWGLLQARSRTAAPAGRPVARYSRQAFFGMSAIVFSVVFGLLQTRNELLAATAGNAPADVATLKNIQLHANRFRDDVHINVRLLKLRNDELRRCSSECDQQREALERWIGEQLQAPMPAPPFYVASVRHATARGETMMARAQLAAGLKQTPGDLGLRALSILLAETKEAREAAFEEALRWQARRRLENALRFFEETGFVSMQAAEK